LKNEPKVWRAWLYADVRSPGTVYTFTSAPNKGQIPLRYPSRQQVADQLANQLASWFASWIV